MDLKAIALILLCHIRPGVGPPVLLNPEPGLRAFHPHVHLLPEHPDTHTTIPTLHLPDPQSRATRITYVAGRHSAEGEGQGPREDRQQRGVPKLKTARITPWSGTKAESLMQRQHQHGGSKVKAAATGSGSEPSPEAEMSDPNVMQKRNGNSLGSRNQDVGHAGGGSEPSPEAEMPGRNVMQKRNGNSLASHQQQDVGHAGVGSVAQGNIVPGVVVVHSEASEQARTAPPDGNSLGQGPAYERGPGGLETPVEQEEAGEEHTSVRSSQRLQGGVGQLFTRPAFRGNVAGSDERRTTRSAVSLPSSSRSASGGHPVTAGPVVNLPPAMNQAQSLLYTTSTSSASRHESPGERPPGEESPGEELPEEELPGEELPGEELPREERSNDSSSPQTSGGQVRGVTLTSTPPGSQSGNDGHADNFMTAGSEIKAGEILPGGGFGLPLVPYRDEEELSSTPSTTTTTTTSAQTSPSAMSWSERDVLTGPVRVTRSQPSSVPHSTATQRAGSSVYAQHGTSADPQRTSGLPSSPSPHSPFLSTLTSSTVPIPTESSAPLSSHAPHSESPHVAGTTESSDTQSSSAQHPSSLSTLGLVNPAQPQTVAEVEHPVFPLNNATTTSVQPLLLSPATSPRSTADMFSVLWTPVMTSTQTEVQSTVRQVNSHSAGQGTVATLVVSTKQENGNTLRGNMNGTIRDIVSASPFSGMSLVTEATRSSSSFASSASSELAMTDSSTRLTSQETSSVTQTISTVGEVSHGGNVTVKTDPPKELEDLTEAVTHPNSETSNPGPSVATTTTTVSSSLGAHSDTPTSTQSTDLVTDFPPTSLSTLAVRPLSTTLRSIEEVTEHISPRSPGSGSTLDESWSSSTTLSTTLLSTFSTSATTPTRISPALTTQVEINTSSNPHNAHDDSKKDSHNRSDSNTMSSSSPHRSATTITNTVTPATAVIHNQIRTPNNASHGRDNSDDNSSNGAANKTAIDSTGSRVSSTNTPTSIDRLHGDSSPISSQSNSTDSPSSLPPTTMSSTTTQRLVMATSSPGQSQAAGRNRSALIPQMTPDLLGPVYIEIKLKMTWTEFCNHEPTFCLDLVDIVREDGQIESFTADQIRILESPQKACALRTSGQQEFSAEEEEIEVQLYLVNKTHHYDVNLTYVCAMVIKQGFALRETSMFNNRLLKVQLHELSRHHRNGWPVTGRGDQGDEGSSRDDDDDDDDFIDEPGVTIVISIAAVGGVCCGVLIVMQLVLRRRYRDGMRAFTNRSSSITSVDSIALNNVIKARPHSGHFNPALDLAPETFRRDHSHPLTFTELTSFAQNLEGIYEEFQLIPNKTPRLSVVPPGAEDKNRFANILPIPGTRVRLDGGEGDDVSTFINANYVSGYGGESRRYIATQAPLEGTVGDLWRMVWQQKSSAIVMLVSPVEDGHKKCATYFPDSAVAGCALTCGEFSITMTKRDVHQEYITSWLQVKNIKTRESRSVRHFWLTCWPIHGKPEPLSLVRFVLDSRPLYEDSGTPLAVHCSNGTARTGTFLALDVCMRQYEDGRTVDVMRCVHSMRQERAGCVQTSEQYALLYQALSEYATILSSPVVSAASSAATLHAMLP